jgi:hypothetical protein
MQRSASVRIQVTAMAAFRPMMMKVVTRKRRDWKMRSRKRQTEILAREICALYRRTKP